ncbi:MAG: hypothetical protein Q4G45_05045 [Actinomycetia bacterium]|nr:hypothetical protein [Actinomycetes bacterium]
MPRETDTETVGSVGAVAVTVLVTVGPGTVCVGPGTVTVGPGTVWVTVGPGTVLAGAVTVTVRVGRGCHGHHQGTHAPAWPLAAGTSTTGPAVAPV